MDKTRKKYPIIGPSIERFSQSQLPTWGQVFARVMHLKEGYPRTKSTTAIVDEVLAELYELWKKANIPTITSINAAKKVTKAFSNYQVVTKKHGGREGELENQRFNDVKEMCLTLCDVATPDVVQKIRSDRLLSDADKECDVTFYLDQKGARRGRMASRDKKYEGKVASKRQRDESEEKRRQKAVGEAGTSESTAVDVDMNPMDTADDAEEDEDYNVTTKTKKPDTVTLTFPRKILKSPKICQMADRLRLSSNQVCPSSYMYSVMLCFL